MNGDVPGPALGSSPAQSREVARTERAALWSYLGHLCCALVMLGPYDIAPATPAFVVVLAAATLAFVATSAWCIGRLAWLRGRRSFPWIALVLILAPIGVPVAIALMQRDATP